METTTRFPSIERARNAAIAWLAGQGVAFGPQRRVEIGRLGVLAGREVGVSGTAAPYWRLRLDYDPHKGPHFNAEHGTGSQRRKAAFLFPGDETLMRKLGAARTPR